MNRLARFLFALWIVTAGITGSPQPCAAEEPVTLRSATEVHRMIVRLSDVFDGIPADLDHDIAQAPMPGKQITYDVNVLTRLAQKYDLEWKAQSLADHVVITTACARITADMIREAVVTKIKALNTTNVKGEVDVAFDIHALEVALPADRPPDFTLNNFDYDAPSKRFHTDLVTDTSSGVFSVPITGHATIKRNVPVLTRRLEGGTTISASDIDFVLVPEEHVNSAVITDVNQLIGHELRRDTNGGDVLRIQDVIPPRYVTRGSLVTLKIETPFMTLTAQGKAPQDGAKGDAVRVINTQSSRMIEGTVEGPGTVRIEPTQKVAAAQ
jgi:flagella basal body P-ring formation protein FlgA